MLLTLSKRPIGTIAVILLGVLNMPETTTAAPSAWKVIEFDAGEPSSEPSSRVWNRKTIPVPLQMDDTISPATVMEIDCQAFVADWDEDAALDGLLVRVTPFNAQGELAEATGHLEVSLHVRRVRQETDGRRIAPKSTVARWSYDVTADDRKILAYECRFTLENDIYEYRRDLREYFITVNFDTGGRSYRATCQAERIALSSQEMSADE